MKEWLPCQFQSLVPQRNPVHCSIYFHLILLTSLDVELGQLISSEFVIFRAKEHLQESYTKEGACVICFTNGLCPVYWVFLISGNA